MKILGCWGIGWVLLAVQLGSANARAERIGINFVGGSTANGTPAPLGSGETAGWIAQRFWNNASGGSGSMNPEGDGDGGSISTFYSGFNVSWSDTFGIRSTPIGDVGGDSRLMKGFLNSDNTPGGAATVTVTGVPATLTSKGYAVVVYFDGDNGTHNRVTRMTLSATGWGSQTLFGLDGANADFAATYKQVPNSSSSDQGNATPDGNFVVFGTLTNTSFTLTVNGASADDGNSRGALNGLQIVDSHWLPAQPAPLISSSGTASGEENEAFAYQIVANNAPTNYDATGLPPGLTVNHITGLLSGVPMGAGNFSVTLSAANANGIGTKVLFLTITPPQVSFTRLNTGTTNRINDIGFLNSNYGMAVGPFGMVLVTTNAGLNWSQSNTFLTNELNAVQLIDSVAFIAGSQGLILYSINGGENWTAFSTGTSATFYGLSFLNSAYGFAVGSGGTISLYNGLNWIPQSSGTINDLYAVYSIGSTAYAVGSGGTICRYSGTGWFLLNSGTNVALHDVAFLNESFGYVVGGNGSIFRTANGGTNWVSLNSGTAVTLRTVRILNANTIFVAGDNGVFLLTTDGGTTWNKLSLATTLNLFAVEFMNGRGFVFGDGGVGFSFVTLFLSVNQPPLISLSAPANGASVWACTPVVLNANATDPDGFVAKVEFFLAGAKIGERESRPYQMLWKTNLPGLYTFVAKATDAEGSAAVSRPGTITVVPPPVHVLIPDGFDLTVPFCLCMNGQTNHAYSVLATTNLAVWTNLGLMIPTNGLFQFQDPFSSTFPRRYYRAVQQ